MTIGFNCTNPSEEPDMLTYAKLGEVGPACAVIDTLQTQQGTSNAGC